MKLILPFIFAMAVTPALAGAQTVAPDTAMPPRPNMAAMQQLHAQMKQIHDQSRAQILASLSPAHRATKSSKSLSINSIASKIGTKRRCTNQPCQTLTASL